MWGYLRFRIYFFATKAEKRIMRGGVLIRRIVGSTGGVLDRNSVSFYESRKTSWTTLVMQQSLVYHQHFLQSVRQRFVYRYSPIGYDFFKRGGRDRLYCI